MLRQDKIFIGGELRRPAGDEFFDVIYPASGEVFGQVPAATEADAAAAVAAARAAFDHGPWPRMTTDERRAVLQRAGQALDERRDELNDLVTHENGLLRKYGWGNTGAFFTAV